MCSYIVFRASRSNTVCYDVINVYMVNAVSNMHDMDLAKVLDVSTHYVEIVLLFLLKLDRNDSGEVVMFFISTA